MKTYIIGHLKPDTDSVVAAMALADLYQNVTCYDYQNPEAVLTGPVNPETAFLLDKFAVTAPRILTAKDLQGDNQVVLVDHNEETQRLEGLKAEQIVEIVDHHKVNLNFEQPIFLTFRVWGSSNTIIADLMQQAHHTPNPKLAALMLAAILSDTVGFKSPTCTSKDQEMAQWLAKLAQIDDLAAFTLEIFKAKSDVTKLSAIDIVKNDYKVFDFAKQKVMIDQLETVEPAKVLTDKKAELLKAMQEVKSELQADLIFVAITDILQVNTKLLILDQKEAEIACKAFGGTVKDQILDIGARLSRKKEIAPPIEKALS
jgi:manganese-dependent inorganic pyrophosphatase